MKTLPRKKIPASQRMRVHLEVGQAGNFIDLCPGAEAYLWIGSDKTCFGCVPDRSVEKLRDMCNAILERRLVFRGRTRSSFESVTQSPKPLVSEINDE